MHRALARIHVEHDPAGARRHLGLCEHLPVHGHQPDEILLSGQQLGLEPMQRRRQRRTPVPDLRRPDETKCRVRRHAHRVVEVFVAREPAVDRLPQEIRQAVSETYRLRPLLAVRSTKLPHFHLPTCGGSETSDSETRPDRRGSCEPPWGGRRSLGFLRRSIHALSLGRRFS